MGARRRGGIQVCAAVAVLLVALRPWALSPPAFSAGGSPTPSLLMKALGRELWVAADELLTVSTKMVPSGGQMANAALSLRNAADLMIEDDFDYVQGELESASVSAVDFIPEECFTGLVDLFGYTEPVPFCEWANAQNSLLSLSYTLRESKVEILRNLEGLVRQETEASITVVAESLQKASALFTPGGFYMPDDPRTPEARVGKGRSRNPEGGSYATAEEAAREFEKKIAGDGALQEARMAAASAGGGAVTLLSDVEVQLREAVEETVRSRLLRRLVRELHPDVNPQRQAEVLPVFRYIQKLREQE